MTKNVLLVIGPEPPPPTGMEIATQTFVAELRRAAIPYLRVDTADPLDELGNRGNWTLHNVVHAIKHILSAVRKSFRRDVAAVYIPIAQEFPGLVRDIIFLIIARAARLPAIVHLHGGALADFYASRTKPTRILLRLTIGRAAVGIVLTEGLRPALECVIPSQRVFVVPNGIDVPTVRPERTRADRNVRVLFLSSLVREKGPFVFIDAFARAYQQCSFLRGTIAGPWASDEIREEVLRRAHDFGVDEVLDFPGPVVNEAKKHLFESADVFCFASLISEGQPLVILEAMAASLPVIAPVGAGIADTVVNGKTGLLVPAGSAQAFAQKLVYLACHSDERLRLGAAGRQRYEQFFTRVAFGDRMIQVIEPFLNRGEKPDQATEAAEIA